MAPTTTVEKLRVLLPHWIEHNQNHAAEFKKWAAAAQTDKADSLAALLNQAAANMTATDELLKKAVTEAGGPCECHHHHGHHHDHEHEHGHGHGHG